MGAGLPVVGGDWLSMGGEAFGRRGRGFGLGRGIMGRGLNGWRRGFGEQEGIGWDMKGRGLGGMGRGFSQ